MPITLHTNLGLPSSATASQTSTVGEPSIANNGQQVLFTGNWYASRSTDGGATWTFTDPDTFFPFANAGFCCDQTAIHAPSHDLTFWLLQYKKDAAGNTLRLAVAVGQTLNQNMWHWWDLVPTGINPLWTGEWFDYNHAALSEEHLYVVTNSFTVDDSEWKRCVVLRFRLDDLRDPGPPAFEYFDTTTNGSLRCTQGAGSVMYLASHNPAEQVRQIGLWAWPDNAPGATRRDVPISGWSDGAYSAPCADGTDWLPRCDSRITAGWVANGIIGFMWTANRQDQRPFPFIRVVRIDESTRSVVDEPDIWSPQFAYAYPDATPNVDGEVGVTLFRGGGSRFPGHVVGAWDNASSRWMIAATRDGTNGPNDGKWGDYLTCRRHAPNGRNWIASGYTLQGGGNRTDIEPRFVVFGV